MDSCTSSQGLDGFEEGDLLSALVDSKVGLGLNIWALLIRIGYGGELCHNYHKDPPQILF